MSEKEHESPPASKDELLQRYANGESDFPGVELDGADFVGVVLDGASYILLRKLGSTKKSAIAKSFHST